MRLTDIIAVLETWAPLAYAEDFDNVGLLVGDKDQQVTGVLVTHDCSEEVVNEAVDKQCNLIVCFHPILFEGLKKINTESHVEQAIRSAIKNDISIYALHTALDNQPHGVSFGLASALELQNCHVLIPKKGTLKKLSFYVPEKDASSVEQALFEVGAGELGDYNQCSFVHTGEGGFRPLENSQPHLGKKGVRHLETEKQVQLVFKAHLEKTVVKTLLENHPYEEVAYEITTLDNVNNHLGMGLIGDLKTPLTAKKFLEDVKTKLGTPVLRHSNLGKTPIKRVAVLGGSGSFAADTAIAKGADAYITADLKYHDFFKGSETFLLVDAGHYETEQFTKKLIAEYLIKKLPNFAVLLSGLDTNPVKYC